MLTYKTAYDSLSTMPSVTVPDVSSATETSVLSEDRVSAGIIAGSTIGVLALLAVGAFAFILIWKRRRQHAEADPYRDEGALSLPSLYHGKLTMTSRKLYLR
jgi:hypothetical protein